MVWFKIVSEQAIHLALYFMASEDKETIVCNQELQLLYGWKSYKSVCM